MDLDSWLIITSVCSFCAIMLSAVAWEVGKILASAYVLTGEQHQQFSRFNRYRNFSVNIFLISEEMKFLLHCMQGVTSPKAVRARRLMHLARWLFLVGMLVLVASLIALKIRL